MTEKYEMDHALPTQYDESNVLPVARRNYGVYGFLFGLVSFMLIVIFELISDHEIGNASYEFLNAFAYYAYLGLIIFMSAGFAVRKSNFNWIGLFFAIIIPIIFVVCSF